MFRADALFLGVLLAWWSRGEVYAMFEPVFLRSRAWARWFTLLFLLGALATVGSDALRIIEYRLSIVAVLSALIVFVASYDRDYLMAPGAIKRFFMWLGSRSYSVYLWHIPVYSLVRELAFPATRNRTRCSSTRAIPGCLSRRPQC
jgi:peptidoglycan/LPS O-acetylase OafA/YrhL